MRCPTVKVVSPESPDGWIVINESDKQDYHVIWTDQSESSNVREFPNKFPSHSIARPAFDKLSPEQQHETIAHKLRIVDVKPVDAQNPAEAPIVPDDAGNGAEGGSLRVAKGPRGKFYLKQGKRNIEGPFETEDAAQMALDGVDVAALDTP